ncbi:MAG: HipA domain-containing protein [Paraglaciecola sp.]|nr:HipA domain-containing protein [Paraglaciecola sp.]
MSFKPIQQLQVTRTLSDGKQVSVGTLAQNKQGVYFQYAEQYLADYTNASPFKLEFSQPLQVAPKTPHNGLHGVFSDSLPDGWGLLLQDRVFRKNSILPHQVTALDRLAFVGNTSIGALSFSPISDYSHQDHSVIDLSEMGLQAQALFDGQTDEVLAALVAAGSSGGARPKAQIYFNVNQPQRIRSKAIQDDDAWIVKFTSKNLSLGHEEGLCEAAYLLMAEQAKLLPATWMLLDAPKPSGAKNWLAVKRFDWCKPAQPNGHWGRLHMLSACGLLDADFRSPSLDYVDLIKASRVLCQSPAAGQLQFRRAMFNLFACNQDDHSKNWAFLQNDSGDWQPAPMYDVTFSPTPFNEHATSFAGYGKTPPIKAIQTLASAAGFAKWQHAQQVIEEVVESISTFAKTAKSLGVKPSTVRLISKQLDNVLQTNKALFK